MNKIERKKNNQTPLEKSRMGKYGGMGVYIFNAA